MNAQAPFPARLRERARAQRRRIVFPESADPRVLEAVRTLSREGVVEPILVLDPAAPHSHADARALHLETHDPARDARAGRCAAELFVRRRHRGLTEEQAESLSRHPLYFADDLVRNGDADGCVAGCVFTTADVLRAALALIGPAPMVQTVSSAFYIVAPAFRGGEDEVLTFTDCAVVPAPTAGQLVDIAIAAAHDRPRIVGDVPVVALLSYSTRGSAEGESVARVREAVDLIRARQPGLAVDGELQGDAALVAAIGARKAPGSPVAGHANVLVFPSLDAGNISYKLVERLAGAAAIGPILQGLAKPCSDLSRGASVNDIIHVAAVTALQAPSPS
jgi:phosphate acetyltransferase